MKNKKCIFFWLFISFFYLQTSYSQTSKAFSFTLDNSSTTSAGVYTSDSVLVKTLWSNVKYTAGKHVEKWDGLLDNGTPAPAGSYHIQVLSSNVEYSWDGARIGNTSTAFTGGSIHRASGAPLGMCVAGNNLYYASGYQERYVANFVTALSDIGSRSRVDGGGNNVAPVAVCSDGITTFWGAYNAGAFAGEGNDKPFTFVYATKVSDGTVKTFTNGVVQPTSHIPYPSTISNRAFKVGLSDIQSMAVQITGTKLFVARNNQIEVYNKNTGQTLQTISVSGKPILAVDAANNLWVGLGSSIKKYTVNNDGTIIATGASLTGISDVFAIAVSPDNSTVTVADGEVTQQVIKGFSNSAGGSAIWTLGTTGGYMNDATVTDNKFYFTDARTIYLTSIAYQPDGSFWVIDGGNSRIQHYSANRNFLERIMYMGTDYVLQVDPNNINRLFATWGGGDAQGGYLEFTVDYTKPLDNGQNGSWKLVKNWGARIDNTYDADRKMTNIVTLSGHTYGISSSKFGGNYDVYELVAGGAIRKTKIVFTTRMAIGKDGTKYWNPSGNVVGSQSYIYKYAYTGLDRDNDPTWSATQQFVAGTPVIDGTVPQLTDKFKENLTSTGKWIFFDPQYYPTGTGVDPHLGAIPIATTNYKWKTSYGTLGSYQGDFPSDGLFDNGNGVGHGTDYQGGAGGYSAVNGQNIIWTYHGEFWKTFQTNMFNHYRDNGLMIGQFGTLRTDYGDAESAYGGAGNALSGSWAQYTDDIAYLYSADEGVNAGVQRWKISGLTSIRNQICNFDSSLNTNDNTGTELMTEITGKGYFTSVGRWVISDPNPVDANDNVWLPFKGSKTASNGGGQDVWVAKSYQPTKTKYITCDLGTNAGLSFWKIDGKINFAGNVGNNFRRDGAYFQILDNAGKAIANFYHSTADFSTSDISCNGVLMHHYDEKTSIAKDRSFEISNTNGILSFQYAGYAGSTDKLADPGANIQKPTTIRLLFEGGLTDKAMGVSELRFRNTAEVITTPDAPSLAANDTINTLSASHPLGDSVIVVCENGGPYLPYTGPITVGNMARTSGYWRFKVKSATGRNESPVVTSPAFTVTTTPDAPALAANDTTNTLSASHPLGDSVIVVCENGGPYLPYTGPITVGNMARTSGYWRFKVKSATGRNESPVVTSPAFTVTTTPVATNIFRSKGSGSWSDTNVWQFSSDAINWLNSTRVPTSADSIISIENGHTITIDRTVTVDQLTINAGGILQVAPNGEVIVNNGTGDDITIASTGSMVIKSDAAGTGRIGNSSGTINGEVSVERYIPAKRAWWLLTAPVKSTTTQTVNAAWQEGATSSTHNPYPGYGTHITGGTAANGFDQSPSNSSNMKYLDNAWVNVTNTNTTRIAERNGYFLFIRGDRSYNITGSAAGSQSTATTLRVKGGVNEGTKSYNFDNTAANQFVLAGNPYAAPVDFTTIGKTNIKNTFWAWDAQRSGTSLGGYVTVSWDAVAGEYDIDYSSAQTKQTQIIQSGQSVLVQVKNANTATSVTFNETDKVSGGSNGVFRQTAGSVLSNQLRINLSRNTGSANTMVDGVLAKFADGYSIGTDDDAVKLNNYDENLSLKRNGLQFSIERRPLITADDTLFLNMEAMKAGSDYNLEFVGTNFDTQSLNAILVDNYLGTKTPLSLTTASNVSFKIDGTSASYAPARFMVVFKASSILPVTLTGIKAWETKQGVQVEWKVESETGVKQYIVERSADMQQFAEVATVKARNNNTAETYSQTDVAPLTGDNFYRIKVIENSGETRYSNVVKIQMAKGTASFKVYPNPVANKKANLQLQNMPEGDYSINLFDQNGRQLLNTIIHHSGNASTQQVALPASIAPGTYYFVLRNAENKELTFKQDVLVL